MLCTGIQRTWNAHAACSSPSLSLGDKNLVVQYVNSLENGHSNAPFQTVSELGKVSSRSKKGTKQGPVSHALKESSKDMRAAKKGSSSRSLTTFQLPSSPQSAQNLEQGLALEDPLLSTHEERDTLACLLEKLTALCMHALSAEQWNASQLLSIDRNFNSSARNLLHYMAFKSMNVSALQEVMSDFGLASLEGIDSHVLASLTQAVQATKLMLKALLEDQTSGKSVPNQLNATYESEAVGLGYQNKVSTVKILSDMTVRASRAAHTENLVALFGPRTTSRNTGIMVTLSEEAVENEALVLDLMKAGMDCVRINCAHGDKELWGKIIQNTRRCSQMLELPCRVLMDLAGPKLRTSPFPAGPRLQKIKPSRDVCGKVTRPARVWLSLPHVSVPEDMMPDAVIPVAEGNFIDSLASGDVLRFTDAQQKQRTFMVVDKIMRPDGVGCVAECHKTTYLESGTELELPKKKGKWGKGYVGDLPSIEHFVRVKRGDLIVLTKEEVVGGGFERNSGSRVHHIGVLQTFGHLFESVKPGDSIKFDDGKIEGLIQGVKPLEICVEVTIASDKGTKLSGGKSINIPDSLVSSKGLTVKDLVDLEFVAGHADMVGLSFLNGPEDVENFQKALEKKGAKSLGIVLKVETRYAVKKLPEILLQAMKKGNPLGVMVARGDLAVECGWDSLGWMQNEVMHICKAARVPTIWATQVLEGLAKEGVPTRPEITDAVVGGRADCVMLNKGVHIVKAVSVLDTILKQSSIPHREVHVREQDFQMRDLFKYERAKIAKS